MGKENVPRLRWSTSTTNFGRPAWFASYRNVVSFRIHKRGSLPSMIAYDLIEGGERVGSRRRLREAKALAEERLAATLDGLIVELRQIERDLNTKPRIVDPWIRQRLGRRRRELEDALA